MIDLTISNPVAAGFAYPHSRIAEILGSVRDVSYNPNPFGEESARTEIAKYYAEFGISIEAGQVALTASTSEAYSVLFKLLCDPADEVLVPTPSYPLFEYLAALDSVCVKPYRLLYAGNWFIDLEHLRSTITPRTRAIIVVNPNNPTGSFLNEAERAALQELATEHGIPLICDEVFMEYPISTGRGLVRTLASEESGLGFCLNGLSKACGMPQLKLGWIIIHGDVQRVAEASHRLEHILDTYLSVGTPVQKALPELLSAGEEIRLQIQKRIAENLTKLGQTLRNSPVHPLQVEGGWSAILQIPATRTEDDWANSLLSEFGVAVQPGYFFDMASEAYVVVSLLTPPDQLQAGLLSLLRLIESG